MTLIACLPIAEHVPGAHMGPLFRKVIMDQFERLRNGDRFWYERKGMFSAGELSLIYKTVRLLLLLRTQSV
jgi:peroxidase